MQNGRKLWRNRIHQEDLEEERSIHQEDMLYEVSRDEELVAKDRVTMFRNLQGATTFQNPQGATKFRNPTMRVTFQDDANEMAYDRSMTLRGLG